MMAGTGSFLFFPVSARESALGGSSTAFDQEISSVSVNPASLTGIRHFGVSFLYNKALFQNHYGNISLVKPYSFGVTGISLSYMGIDMDRIYQFGENTGSRNISHLNIGLALQKDLLKNFSVGGGVKYIKMDLIEHQSSTIGFDLGFLYSKRFSNDSIKLNIGSCFRNFGLKQKFNNEDEDLPQMISTGFMLSFPKLARKIWMKEINIISQCDYLISNQYYRLGGGLEIAPFSFIKMRGGYRLMHKNSFITCGSGIEYKWKNRTKVSLDYSINLNQIIGNTHYIGLQIQGISITKQPQKNPEIDTSKRGSVIRLKNDVLFEYNKYQIKKDALSYLNKIYKQLIQYKDYHIVIEGNTDNTGDYMYNLGLSEKRAKAVYDYFIKKGVQKEKLRYKGQGQTNPIASNKTKTGRKKNRRVDIIVLNKIEDKSILNQIAQLPEQEYESVKAQYFEGLDRYYKEDKKGAINIWKQIKTHNKELQNIIQLKIKQTEEEI